MFTKVGIIDLHTATHERLDLLLRHVATVPDDLCHKPISGFGHASIWKQLVHVLTCEEGWVHDLQNKTFPGWHEEDCPTVADLQAAKTRIREATQLYVRDLTEEQLNTTLQQRTADWGGELRSPAFILLHVMTHAFHHKGPDCRDAADSRLPSTGYRSAAGVVSSLRKSRDCVWRHRSANNPAHSGAISFAGRSRT
jgi:uncharacterized damage-inducible protein DinB